MSVSTRLAAATAFHTLSVGDRLGLDGWRLIAEDPQASFRILCLALLQSLLTSFARLKWKAMLWIHIRIRIYRFNGVSGHESGSGFAIRIRIQEGKNDPRKMEKS
jgi:hypothetical protein